MINTQVTLVSFVSALTLASSLTAAVGDVLMLDFGTTTTTGGNLTNSPYHTTAAGFTDSSWNTIHTSDVTSGLLYSNGLAATGVEVDLGRSSISNKDILTFAGAPLESTLGTAMNTGVYAGDSVGKDAIFYNNSGNDSYVGLTISGLSAGTYDIYITGANTNTLGSSMSFWGIATPDNANIDTSLVGAADGTASNTITASWIEGGNYAKLSITSTIADDQLTIFAKGTDSGQLRGFINSVQVVSVPEPTTSASILGIASLLLVARRRSIKR